MNERIKPQLSTYTTELPDHVVVICPELRLGNGGPSEEEARLGLFEKVKMISPQIVEDGISDCSPEAERERFYLARSIVEYPGSVAELFEPSD